MSDPYAQAEAICIDDGCCADLETFKSIVDSLTRVIVLLQSSRCAPREVLDRIVNKLVLSKRAVLNAINSLEAVIRGADISNRDGESALNSLLNIATRLIECRNDVNESKDDVSQFRCGDEIQSVLSSLSNQIDANLIVVLALILVIASRVKVDYRLSGRLSSIAASALFSSLMSIYIDSVQEKFSKCFSRKIKLLK